MEALELADGPGGWLQATARGEDDVHFWVHLDEDEGGLWVPTGALVVLGLTPARLRSLPLNRVLLAVNASGELRRQLADRVDEEVPELGSDGFLSAFSGYLHPEPEVVLERPASHRLPEEFYDEVAKAYTTATALGLRPRTAIARAAGVSTDVAGRWVREARKLKKLPETTSGKVRA